MPIILIIIGFVLIIYNYRVIKKENEMKRDGETLNISFQSVLQDNKEELNDYKMEIGLLRRDIAESLTELQEEIVDIRNNLNNLNKNRGIYENKEELENDIDSYKKNEYNKGNNCKVEKHNQLDDFIDKNLFVDLDIEDGTISEIDFSGNVGSTKTQNIKRLLNEGLIEEEICKELSVSKGEVLLVKGLFKK
jgi:hypothetical protein